MTIRESTIADIRALRDRLQRRLERLETERDTAAYNYTSMLAWLDDQARDAAMPTRGEPTP